MRHLDEMIWLVTDDGIQAGLPGHLVQRKTCLRLAVLGKDTVSRP